MGECRQQQRAEEHIEQRGNEQLLKQAVWR
jgi:hypothetical protein